MCWMGDLRTFAEYFCRFVDYRGVGWETCVFLPSTSVVLWIIGVLDGRLVYFCRVLLSFCGLYGCWMGDLRIFVKYFCCFVDYHDYKGVGWVTYVFLPSTSAVLRR
jgi:hypothetical protein